MKLRTVAASTALLAAFVLGQEPAEPPASPPRILAAIERLGDPDFKARRAAEKELREIGEPAIEHLREAMEDHEDAEVRWRARRLVRRIEGGDSTLRRPEAIGEQGGEPAPAPRRDRFESLLERFERGFGSDFGWPREMSEHLELLQRQMDEMRQRMNQGAPPLSGPLGPGIDWQQLEREGSGVRVEIGPDGVKVRTERQNEDGESEVEEFEAPDLESFRERYPRVAERYLGRGGGLRWTTPFGGWDARPAPRSPVIEEPAPPPPPPGERLGVWLGDLAPEVRTFLGLEPGHGLLVDRVEEASLAADLGITAGDLVLEVAGRAIRGPQDVAEALRGVDAGNEVVVVVNRRGRELELKAVKPAAEASRRLEVVR